MFFLIRTTSNYLWASEICKNHGFEVDNFAVPFTWAPKSKLEAQNEWKK